MSNSIPVVVMRGGSSRGVFFLEQDLPESPVERQQIFLSVLGSPDPTERQVDGLGGGVSSTSKIAVISRSKDPAYDVVYHFAQVAVTKPTVDFDANCGNILSAVAPFAIDQGLVPVTEPTTTVRIHQLNTDRLVIAEVPIKNGAYQEQGKYQNPGVQGTGGKITLRLMDPAGGATGKLLPTGNVVDHVSMDRTLQSVTVTIIDAGNPTVLVAAADLEVDLATLHSPLPLELAERLESIRAQAAVLLGFAANEQEATELSQAIPKISIVSPPQRYTASNGTQIPDTAMDFCIRTVSMGNLHGSIPITSAISAAGAAIIEGTVANRCLVDTGKNNRLWRLGHSSGVTEISTRMTRTDQGSYHYDEAIVFRTARKIMSGIAYLQQ